MCPRPDADDQRRVYSYPHDVPRELEEALSVALSTRQELGDGDEEFPPQMPALAPAVARQLSLAVSSFVAKLKDEGQPPENVVIAIKTVLRQYQTKPWGIGGSTQALQRLVVLTAVKAYYGAPDAPPVVERTASIFCRALTSP